MSGKLTLAPADQAKVLGADRGALTERGYGYAGVFSRISPIQKSGRSG